LFTSSFQAGFIIKKKYKQFLKISFNLEVPCDV